MSQAPKGRTNRAQANGLGFADQAVRQALKGRPKPLHSFIPDAYPSQGLNRRFVDRPFRARPENNLLTQAVGLGFVSTLVSKTVF